jgi:molybdopterin converting factor small subunit
VGTTTVRLPGVLQPVVGDRREVMVSGATVREAVEDLCAQLPALRSRILDEEGALRPHVLCVHRGEPTRLTGPQPLADGDDLAIVPAVSGG